VNLELSDRAKNDLIAIRAYTIDKHGATQAIRYRGQLEHGFSTLRRFPGIGLVDRRLPRGHQAFRVSHHWICYEIVADVIEVKAIIRHLDDFEGG